MSGTYTSHDLPSHDLFVTLYSMTFCVIAGIVGGAIAYYIALVWATAAIVYFEVGVANHTHIMTYILHV